MEDLNKEKAELKPEAVPEKVEAPKDAALGDSKPKELNPAEKIDAPKEAAASISKSKNELAVEAPSKKVKPANCEACNKSIKVKWYYRNGKFYCTKQCFKAEQKKSKADTKEAASK